MRIAVVGSGRSVHVLARSAALAARGHEVRLVTAGEVLEAEGLEVRTRPLPRTLTAAVGAARAFLRDLRAPAPDLLHLHYAGGRLGTLALASGVRPLVVTVMGGDVLPEQHRGGLSRLEQRATRRILAAADLVLVKSDALRGPVAALGAPGRVETVRWGVDAGIFRRDEAGARALRARLGLAPDDRVILSPRALQPLYNVHLLVEALPEVLAAHPTALLLATAYNEEPSFRAALEERARALGVAGRMRIVPRVPHAEMPALFSLAEAVASIPSSDGLPQTVFEAAACGAPLVVGALAAYDEVLPPDAALRVPFAAPAVAAALCTLLGDPARRAGQAARAEAAVREAASLPQEAARVEALYREVLAAPRRPGPGPLGRWLELATLAVR